jgi:hypothetical protein
MHDVLMSKVSELTEHILTCSAATDRQVMGQHLEMTQQLMKTIADVKTVMKQQ